MKTCKSETECFCKLKTKFEQIYQAIVRNTLNEVAILSCPPCIPNHFLAHCQARYSYPSGQRSDSNHQYVGRSQEL